MRSHVLLAADLIDPYRSPRCNPKHGPWSFFYQPYTAHTFMTLGGSIVSIASIVWGAQQYAPFCRQAQHAFLCSVPALRDNVIST
jgi:hypothetical protein